MKKRIIIGLIILTILIVGLCIPQGFIMPVEGTKRADYHPKSFWFYPWGKSVTHKGIDIFAKEGTNLHSSTGGLVVYSGHVKFGGNVVLILGPKWRIHYYAHLSETKISSFSWTNRKKIIGTVGSSGNAAGKAPHLHYSIVTYRIYGE